MITLITAHLVTIITATIIGFIAGMVWYDPRAFGTIWGKEQPHRNIEKEMAESGMHVMFASLFDSLFFTLMAFVMWSAYQFEGILLLALAVSIGVYTNTIAKGGTRRLFYIDAGFLLCQLAIITITILVLAG